MPYKDPAKQSEYQRQWAAKRRQDWLDANGPCAHCGSWEDPEVDHLDPSKKVSHRVWSWSESRRAAELAKCQVLCRDCHRDKTNAWLRSKTKHGTRNMYERYGCKCDPCKEAKRRHNAQRYAGRHGSTGRAPAS